MKANPPYPVSSAERPRFMYIALGIIASIISLRLFFSLYTHHPSTRVALKSHPCPPVEHIKVDSFEISNEFKHTECECRPSIGKNVNQVLKFTESLNSSEEPVVTRLESGGVLVKEFEGEFGYELIVVLPFVYAFHKNNELVMSSSCGNMMPFYFFSENHTNVANCEKNDVGNDITGYNFGMDDMHKGFPPSKNWIPPPLKSSFCGCPPLWDENSPVKKLVVISNKYTMEWQGPPVNFIKIPLLIRIVNRFIKNGFYVVYNRAANFLSHDPSQPNLQYSDFATLEAKFKSSNSLAFMHEIAQRHPDLTLNEVQVRIMSRSRCFLSVQGGNSILSSYFGGWNIIYARRGKEVKFGAYDRFYYRLSGARVEHTNNHTNYEELTSKMAMSHHCNIP